jgi:hypothetical protein
LDPPISPITRIGSRLREAVFHPTGYVETGTQRTPSSPPIVGQSHHRVAVTPHMRDFEKYCRLTLSRTRES